MNKNQAGMKAEITKKRKEKSTCEKTYLKKEGNLRKKGTPGTMTCTPNQRVPKRTKTTVPLGPHRLLSRSHQGIHNSDGARLMLISCTAKAERVTKNSLVGGQVPPSKAFFVQGLEAKS